uniref:Uncharacterized protein n=1 Tax=Nelumbo nucifera TaxID=4432 RepID=A0A822Y610_NELNU|nr:TPA_asm: hypothetical protein HUJ06_028237 [Nelumbo nucifera]
MLHVSEACIEKNYHPSVICRAYNQALEDAIAVLDKIAMSVDVNDRPAMLGLVKSCIATKFTSQFGDLIADLAIDATMTVGVDVGPGLREVVLLNTRRERIKQMQSWSRKKIGEFCSKWRKSTLRTSVHKF